MHQSRLAILSIYMIIFLFSIYSIIQIRLILYEAQVEDSKGSFRFLFFYTPEMNLSDFILVKISLFVVTAVLSFVLMLSNFYVYNHPNLEKRLEKSIDREISKMMKS